ncbi:MAG: 3-dehydroquinate synthase [Pirellulaceae bacterium]
MSFDTGDNSTHFDVDFSVPMTHRLRFTQDCFGNDFDALRELFEPNVADPARVQVWVDSGLANPEFNARLERQFAFASELQLTSLNTLEGGEAVKNAPDIINRLLQAFDGENLDRRSYVLAIGGGALLDAVGYAAAIAHRGLRLVRVPTTTLSQADSGVGVKNAVNWFGKKNWKGTFATPWAVINDAQVLTGLNDRDFRCGFSEAVKVALLKDPAFFEFLVARSNAIAERESVSVGAAIKRAVLLHLEHITRGGDPFEALQARPLDFGHWSAHKLEAVTNYELRHGEAVSIGVALDTAYSFLTQGLPLEIAEQTIATLQQLKLPVWHPALAGEVIFEGLEEFRQHLGGELTITLLRDVGSPIDVHNIKLGAMKEAIEMVSYYAGADSKPDRFVAATR